MTDNWEQVTRKATAVVEFAGIPDRITYATTDLLTIEDAQ